MKDLRPKRINIEKAYTIALENLSSVAENEIKNMLLKHNNKFGDFKLINDKIFIGDIEWSSLTYTQKLDIYEKINK